jgi:hypothetical protein
VKLALTDATRKEFGSAARRAARGGAEEGPDDQQAVLKQLIDAIRPTLKGGELDAAASLTAPDDKGHVQLVAALAVADGKKIEAFVKNVVDQYGALLGGVVEFKLDAEKVGDFNLHRIELKQEDETLQKVFGTQVIWLATSDTALAVSIEPDGGAAEEGAEGEGGAGASGVGRGGGRPAGPAGPPGLKPDELKALLKDAFGDGSASGKDAVTFAIQGGEQLTVRFKVKGKAIRFGAGLDAIKGK